MAYDHLMPRTARVIRQDPYADPVYLNASLPSTVVHQSTSVTDSENITMPSPSSGDARVHSTLHPDHIRQTLHIYDDHPKVYQRV